jgi:hypothetical protein
MRSLITQGGDVNQSSLTIALTSTLASMMGLAQEHLDILPWPLAASTWVERGTQIREACRPLCPTACDRSTFCTHRHCIFDRSE